nr:MAG TPA: DNA ligase [Caudoviricetes sp.]
MLSLSNVFNKEELADFVNKVSSGDTKFYLDPKLDGLAISITYNGGELSEAATRGDGSIGEDVTVNVSKIPDVPLTLKGECIPDKLVIRGEVYITRSNLELLNQAMKDKQYSNCRNAAAGILRSINGDKVKYLSFMCYMEAYNSNMTSGSHSVDLNRLIDYGIPVNQFSSIVSSVGEIIDYCDKMMVERETLPYDIDGVVIKVDDRGEQLRLGSIAKSPRWATAFKFPAKATWSTAEGVIFTVGRTGAITPVLKITPVVIGGVVVSSVTLHNYDEYKRLNISLGDAVAVVRSGDVIPKVVSVAKTSDIELPSVEFPTNCPSCNSSLVDHMCVNTDCECKSINRIINAVSKSCLDIDGLGETIVEDLYNEGSIKDIADVYGLTIQQIRSLRGQGYNSANKLYESIQSKKIIPLDRFISALGIEGVGTVMAKRLASHLLELDMFRVVNEGMLRSINGVGDKLTQSIVSWVSNEVNQKLIDKFIQNGCEVKSMEGNPTNDKPIRVVITGTIEGFSREALKEALTKQGIEVIDNVTRDTSFVLMGDKPGSKVNKALHYGVPVITKEEFDFIMR